jgi:1,4-alpha-glucan branching enzyme
VDYLHRNGIGVILDWVPGHFATDEWALARSTGTPSTSTRTRARAGTTRVGLLIFDFGRPEVRNFLVANATYWLEEFHIDGLRVDGVASMLYLDYSRQPGEWIPNQYGGRENLDAVAVLQEPTPRHTSGSRRRDRSPRSRPPGVGSRKPTDEGGPGLRASSGTWAG